MFWAGEAIEPRRGDCQYFGWLASRCSRDMLVCVKGNDVNMDKFASPGRQPIATARESFLLHEYDRDEQAARITQWHGVEGR